MSDGEQPPRAGDGPDAERKKRTEDFMPPGGKVLADMSYEERLGFADSYKKAGNTFFGEGKFEWAKKNYKETITFVEKCLFINDAAMPANHADLPDDAKATVVAAHSNTAACHLKLSDYSSAIKACDAGLPLAGKGGGRDRAKLLFRRAQAKMAIGRLADAVEDLEAASAANPEDAAVRKELSKSRAALAREARAEKAHLRQSFKGFMADPNKGLGFKHEDPKEAAPGEGGPFSLRPEGMSPMDMEEMLEKIRKKKEETPRSVKFFLWCLETADRIGVPVEKIVNKGSGIYNWLGGKWVALVRSLFPSIYAQAVREAREEMEAKEGHGAKEGGGEGVGGMEVKEADGATEGTEKWAEQMEARAAEAMEARGVRDAEDDAYVASFETEEASTSGSGKKDR